MDQGDDTTVDGGSSKPGDGKRARRTPPPIIELTAVPDQAAPDAHSGPELANPAPEMPKSDDRTSDMPPGGSDPAGPPRRAGFARPLAMILAAAAGVAITVAVALTIAGLTTGTPPSDPALTDRVGAIVAELDTLKSSLKSAVDPKEIAALQARLAAMETQFSELSRRPEPAGADPAKITALDGRLDDVTKRLAAVEQMGQRLDEITARIAKIETALTQPRPTESDPVLLLQIGKANVAVNSLLSRMTDLEKRLDAVAATEREAAAHQPAVAAADQAIRRAFLATALRNAVERGTPFTAELAAFKTLATDKAPLAALDAFAASGVPSTSALAHELSALVPALLAAANPPRGDGSVMDRLGMATRQLIRVRRVGDAAGDDPVSVIARIELKAAHDDVAGALAEFAKLPENVRAPADAWIKKATQRIAALDATQKLTADALAGLALPGPKPAP